MGVLSRRTVLSGVLPAAFGASACASSEQGRSMKPSPDVVLYLVPHQDDELISMVGGITQDVAAGRDVHVWLVTTGGYSDLPRRLCEANSADCMTPQQFVASRNAELTDSLAAMGVHTWTPLGVAEEGPGYPRRADDVVKKAIAEFGPGLALRSMSWLDLHPAHLALGYAADRASLAGQLTECIFFQSPLYQAGTRLATKPVPTPAGEHLSAPADVVRDAVAAYRRIDRAEGRFGIGYRSVARQLDWINRYRASWAHRDSSSFSEADAAEAARWIRENQNPSWYSLDP